MDLFRVLKQTVYNECADPKAEGSGHPFAPPFSTIHRSLGNRQKKSLPYTIKKTIVSYWEHVDWKKIHTHSLRPAGLVCPLKALCPKLRLPVAVSIRPMVQDTCFYQRSIPNLSRASAGSCPSRMQPHLPLWCPRRYARHKQQQISP